MMIGVPTRAIPNPITPIHRSAVTTPGSNGPHTPQQYHVQQAMDIGFGWSDRAFKLLGFSPSPSSTPAGSISSTPSFSSLDDSAPDCDDDDEDLISVGGRSSRSSVSSSASFSASMEASHSILNSFSLAISSNCIESPKPVAPVTSVSRPKSMLDARSQPFWPSSLKPVSVKVTDEEVEEVPVDVESRLQYQQYSGLDDPDCSLCSPPGSIDYNLNENEDLFKTELCRNWGNPGYDCQYGATCNFAHGPGELRERRRRGEFKSKLCDEPVRVGIRRCAYTTIQQNRCNYCHPGEPVRRKCNRSYLDSEYQAMIEGEFPGNPCPFGIFL